MHNLGPEDSDSREDAQPNTDSTEDKEAGVAKIEESEKKEPPKPWEGVDFKSLDKVALVDLY